MFSTKSPMRFDLAGGTLDLWPIWAMLPGSMTVNASIGLYSYCEIEPLKGPQIIIESSDFKKKWEFNNRQELLYSQDPEVLFYQAHVSRWQTPTGFRIATRSESPMGGGLGGSSSLSISVYQTFLKWLGQKESLHEIVRACSNIEAFILKTPTGTQDYYGAISQGLNLIEFHASGTHLQTLQVGAQLGQKLLLVYTGKSHHSGINNWQVLKKFIDGDTETISALHIIRDAAQNMKVVCEKGQWEKIPGIFAQEYEARLMLADSFVSPEILKLKEIADQSGSDGFKICGAGGGGCVGLWIQPEKRSLLVKAVQREGFQVLDAQIL